MIFQTCQSVIPVYTDHMLDMTCVLTLRGLASVDYLYMLGIYLYIF